MPAADLPAVVDPACERLDNETGAFTLENYAAVLTRPRYLRTLGNTFIGGIGGMLGALLLGVTLAHLVTRYRLRGVGVVTTLAVIALVTPPFIGAYAWIVLFGANGVVRNALANGLGVDVPPIYGAAGVIAVFSLKFFPARLPAHQRRVPGGQPSLEEAGESLGLSPARRFFKVTLPLVMPAISASALLTFILSIADFGTPRIIGRSFQMLSTEAFILFAARDRRQSRHGFGDQHGVAGHLDGVRARCSAGSRGAAHQHLAHVATSAARRNGREPGPARCSRTHSPTPSCSPERCRASSSPTTRSGGRAGPCSRRGSACRAMSG